MNKKILILIVVCLILFVSVFYFIKTSNQSVNTNDLDDESDDLKDEKITPPQNDLNNTPPLQESLELKINFTKETFAAGETPEEAYYFVDYKNTDPLAVLVLFGKTKNGLVKKSYNKYRGNLDSIFRSYISEKFDCDGNYVYYLSVYDCNSVNKLLGTEKCGKELSGDKYLKNIDQNLEALYSIQKEITVNCPIDNSSCCSNLAYSCISDHDCLNGYYCNEGNCLN